MVRLSAFLLLSVLCCAQKLPFDAAAMMKLVRISDPQLSPDGRQVLFTAQRIDVEKNARPQQVYVVPASGAEAPKQVSAEGTNFRARWSPDGKRLAMISTRSGSAQIWMMNADGSEARQVTNLSTEADGVTFSPDGQLLLFVSEVYPECGADDACNRRKLQEESASKVKARTYTSLLYRHWNQFSTRRRKHLLVIPAEGGKARDLTPGSYDVPPFSLGGPDDYAFSPDSKEVCYAVNTDVDAAMSTNADLYVVPVSGGEPKKVSVSTGADLSPQYSPDGKYLVWRAQMVGGYESDRWRLMVMDRGTGAIQAVTEATDRSVQSFTFTPNSAQIVFTVDDRGKQVVFRMPITGGSSQLLITGKASYDDVQVAADGRTFIYTQVSGDRPVEIYRGAAGEQPVPLTRLNEPVLNEYDLRPFEDFYVAAPDKARVHSFLLKPHGFEAAKKYPVIFLIHGGPESHWGETWTYRWNAQVFAAAGYVVVMPNPRGSTGYGQKFTEEIQADWGGRPYEDIMAVVDHVSKLPYVDGDRMAAAGGSYGGYMVNWLLGHTDRFKALVSHAGVYDLRSMAGETEELWFVNWEFKGMPWENPELYEKNSPSNFVSQFKTPTLVTHGELDYRVPVGQGMQLFTGLQRMKVPSKLLLYPDEGHWILKPQNSLLWYQSVLDWIGEFTKKVNPPSMTRP